MNILLKLSIIILVTVDISCVIYIIYDVIKDNYDTKRNVVKTITYDKQ